MRHLSGFQKILDINYTIEVYFLLVHEMPFIKDTVTG